MKTQTWIEFDASSNKGPERETKDVACGDPTSRITFAPFGSAIMSNYRFCPVPPQWLIGYTAGEGDVHDYSKEDRRMNVDHHLVAPNGINDGDPSAVEVSAGATQKKSFSHVVHSPKRREYMGASHQCGLGGDYR